MRKNTTGIEDQEEDWDFEKAQSKSARTNRRTVVSVSLPRQDFEVIANAAERDGVSLSEYFRTAAVEKAIGKEVSGKVTWAGSSSGTFNTSAEIQQSTYTYQFVVSGDGNLDVHAASKDNGS
jgi:hypothetical protein